MMLNRNFVFGLVCTGLLFAATNSHATEGDAQRGKALHAEKCAACHAEKSGLGDGDVIYTRSDRRVGDLKKLVSQVARCSAELRLDLFPEDEADLVQYLNKTFYKFP